LFWWCFFCSVAGAGDIRGGGGTKAAAESSPARGSLILIAGFPGERSAPNSIRLFTAHRSTKDFFMKKKSRIEIEREIVSRVRREMDKPRLTESVRNGFGAQPAPAIEKPSAHSARA
jgi:hypothetical protein